MNLDWKICSRARLARDARFDGKFFIGVLSTKIYCRPICRGRTAKESNIRYFLTAAAAAEAGFRPCLRCRPECSPGTPAWAGTQNTVSRALQLIGEMGLEDGGVEALAEHLGMGSRHLRRLFLRHLGATPSAVAHTRRLHFAKRLIDETTLPMTQIAFAAGFGSVRRFNAAIRNVYHRTPSQIRCLAGRMVRQPENHYLFHLSFRPPYDWESILEFLAAHTTPGVEVVRDGCFRRSISLRQNHGYLQVSLDANRNALEVRVQFADPRLLFLITERVRAMFDLDADWPTISRTLAPDPALSAHVTSRPGLRVPGCWNGFELATLAILGQGTGPELVTPLAGRMVKNFGQPHNLTDGLTHLFPLPEVLAVADLESIGLPRAQADAIRALSCQVRDGQISFDKVADADAVVARLRGIPGIARSALQWIAMRALREPDAIPSFDPEFVRALGVIGPTEFEERSEAWRPWRAYAAMYLWRVGRRVSAREYASTCPANKRPSVGSRLIEHVPSDAYSSSRSVLRHLVKSAHDAYLALERGQLEEENLERAVVISRQRHGDKTGHFYVEDNGIGQPLKHLLRNVQMSISRDLQCFKADSASGNLCSWPILSAGSKVVIESSTKRIAGRFHLEINVRRICERMDAARRGRDILSDSECISLSSGTFDKRGHGTTVAIECDGKTEIVNGYLLNCFYDLTEPEDETLLQFLAEGCPIPYSMEDSVGQRIAEVYARVGYLLTKVYLDGRSLKRQVPPNLSAFQTQEIKIGRHVAAIAWYVEDPKRTRVVDVQVAKQFLTGPGIQIAKGNVPIGPKNLFSDGVQERLLNRLLGEVHIISRYVEPDASGQDLRRTTARESFIEELRKFYSQLQDKAEARSQGLMLKGALRRGPKQTSPRSAKVKEGNPTLV